MKEDLNDLMQADPAITYAIQLIPDAVSKDKIAPLHRAVSATINGNQRVDTNFHISICLFRGKEGTLKRWISLLEGLSQETQILRLMFNKVALFSNQSLMLLPDEENFARLQSIFQSIIQQKVSPVFSKSRYPHITLAKELNPSTFADISDKLPFSPISVLLASILITNKNQTVQISFPLK